MFDKGYFKGPLLCASALLVTGTFLIAECTEFWQFMLCQGIAVGVSHYPYSPRSNSLTVLHLAGVWSDLWAYDGNSTALVQEKAWYCLWPNGYRF